MLLDQQPDADSSKPRYLQLAEELRAEILSGALLPDKQFPTESKLCKRFEVSRFTVREALRRLETEGLITRRRGSGTIIQPAAARGGTLHQPLSNVGEILQYARDTKIRFNPEGLTPIPRRIAERLAEDVRGEWLHFRGQRMRDGDDQPIALTDAYIHPDLKDAVEHFDPTRNTLFRQLEEFGHTTTSRVTQDIQAVSASADVAVALGIPRRSACLRILRCYFDKRGRLFEVSVSHHPGESFAYSMHIDVDA